MCISDVGRKGARGLSGLGRKHVVTSDNVGISSRLALQETSKEVQVITRSN